MNAHSFEIVKDATGLDAFSDCPVFARSKKLNRWCYVKLSQGDQEPFIIKNLELKANDPDLVRQWSKAKDFDGRPLDEDGRRLRPEPWTWETCSGGG